MIGKTVALDGILISKFLLDKQRGWRGEDILDLGSTRRARLAATKLSISPVSL